MNSEDANSIDERFEEWRIAFEQHGNASIDEWCADRPELCEPLARRAAAWRRLNQTWNTAPVDHDYAKDLDDSALTGKDHVDLSLEYRDLKHLATGGLGVVYEASDAILERTVAIKTERATASSDDAHDPFVLEARITAGLDHPGVVPVYGMGRTESGSTFYSMRMVKGATMGEAIESFHEAHVAKTQATFLSREFHDLLARFATVCKTIAYAHSRGIIHCDIKPRNILFGRFGETIVLDWGAARSVSRDENDQLGGEENLDVSHSDSTSTPTKISGTLPYMSPEQAAGGENLTQQSDVFSLGVTLYAMLTGKTPYTGTSSHAIRQQIIRADYPSPRAVVRQLSPAIEAICLKAMSNDPVDRYSSALDLAEDVERFVADETIPWFRESVPRKLARQVRRHRNATLVATVALISIALLTSAFMVWQSSLAYRERQARRQGLVVRAALAADSIRYELDRRIWALEDAAKLPDVRMLLTKRSRPQNADGQSGFDSELCTLLDQIATPYAGQLDSYCWFINADDRTGTQVARFPARNELGEPFKSLGKSYATREYFHGQVKLEQPNVEKIAPLRRPHITAPFRGTHGEFVIAISVPVFSGQKTNPESGEPIGVIGMAVRVGDITVVDQAIVAGDLLVIGNLNQDFIEQNGEAADGKTGLIMQHPVFQTQIAKGASAWVPRLDAATLELIGNAPIGHPSQGSLLSATYRDPVGRVSRNFAGKWLASQAIVNRPSRLPKDFQLGWVIILQERP